MSTLRSNINVKALGLHWRDDRLLAADVYDSRGQCVGVRPLGGTVEFGETAETALKREFLEELGVEVEVLSGPLIIENLYEFEGECGHEIMFVFHVSFVGAEYRDQDSIVFKESDATSGVARWHPLDELDTPGSLRLYPKGLKDLLEMEGAGWRG